MVDLDEVRGQAVVFGRLESRGDEGVADHQRELQPIYMIRNSDVPVRWVLCTQLALGMGEVDDWAAKQEDEPGRSEAIRRLVEIGLKTKATK
jgi:hypothetical protein